MNARSVLTLAAAGAVALAAAPPAGAQEQTFTGKTRQDRPVTLRVGADGVVQFVRIAWRTRRCRQGGASLTDRTDFRPPLDDNAPHVLGDAGRYTVRRRGGIRIRVTVTVAGEHVPDPANAAAPGSWRGTIKASAVVRRRGRVIDRCSLRSTGWTATA